MSWTFLLKVMAAFQVFMYGRFWVFTEAKRQLETSYAVTVFMKSPLGICTQSLSRNVFSNRGDLTDVRPVPRVNCCRMTRVDSHRNDAYYETGDVQHPSKLLVLVVGGTSHLVQEENPQGKKTPSLMSNCDCLPPAGEQCPLRYSQSI